MLNTRAVERLERVGDECIVVACDALVARLKRISEAGRAGERIEAARVAHVKHAEAALNLISVLRAQQHAEAPRLGLALDVVLRAIPDQFRVADTE